MGVQPQRVADLCQLSDAGRPGLQVTSSLPRTAGPLPQRVRAGRRDAQLASDAGAGGPRLCAYQLRQGLGPQVQPAGGDSVSDVARSAAGAL